MLYPPLGIDRASWLRANTDALFKIFSAQLAEGDIYDTLYRSQEDAILSLNDPNECFIFRVRITGRWCLKHSFNQTINSYDSFTRAFIELRRIQIKNDVSPILVQSTPSSTSHTYSLYHQGLKNSRNAMKRVNLAQLDDWLFVRLH
jgi:hypothetical protein